MKTKLAVSFFRIFRKKTFQTFCSLEIELLFEIFFLMIQLCWVMEWLLLDNIKNQLLSSQILSNQRPSWCPYRFSVVYWVNLYPSRCLVVGLGFGLDIKQSNICTWMKIITYHYYFILLQIISNVKFPILVQK